MHNKSRITVRAALTNSKTGVTWLILMSASTAFFAVGFIVGVVRVALGLHQEHRKFADLVTLVRAELSYLRIAAGLSSSAAYIQEETA